MKKKKKFNSPNNNLSINKLPIINGKMEDNKKLKLFLINEKNGNSSYYKLKNNIKKENSNKRKESIENVKLKFHPKFRTNSDIVNDQLLTNCMNTQYTFNKTNTEESVSKNSSIQFFKISNLFNKTNSKEKPVKLNKKSFEERDLKAILSGRKTDKIFKNVKYNPNKTQSFKHMIFMDSESENNSSYLSNYIPRTYSNYYFEKNNKTFRDNNFKKTIKRQLSKSPMKNKKGLNYYYNNLNNNSNQFDCNDNQKKNIKNMNLSEYLSKERKKLDVNKYLSYGKKIYIEKIKNELLINSKNLINEKKNNLLKNNIIERPKFNDFIKKLYHIFFNESILISKNLKKLEFFLVKYFLASFSLTQTENINMIYVLDKFFNVYKKVIQYIFNKDSENNESTKLKSCDSEYYKNIYKIIRSANKCYINRIFLIDIISFDFKISNNLKEIHFKQLFPCKRKQTRKRKKQSLLSFIKFEKKKRNSIFENISSIVKKKKEEIDEKDLKYKFFKTNNYIENWNPHYNKNFLINRNKKYLKENQLIKAYFKREEVIKSKLSWNKNMELLKNLGGDPMSKENSLLRIFEFQEKNSNSPKFERLFKLIDRGQNSLFEKKFSEFKEQINNRLYKTGDTLLIQAVKNGNEPIIEFLINKGCNLNIQNYLGNTALHIAFLKNNLNIINFLIESGANESIVNNNGLTPWELMKQC